MCDLNCKVSIIKGESTLFCDTHGRVGTQLPEHQHKYTVVVMWKYNYLYSSSKVRSKEARVIRCESCDSEIERG